MLWNPLPLGHHRRLRSTVVADAATAALLLCHTHHNDLVGLYLMRTVPNNPKALA